MIKKAFLFSILLALSLTSFGQEGCDPNVDNTCEVCDNGTDDNGDGKIDSLDPLCASFYGLDFIGPDTDCSVTPPATADFFNVVASIAVSGQNTVDTQSKMAIGDVDGDGIPDVIATTKWNQQIRVIATTDDQDDGSDAGDIKFSWKTTDKSPGDIIKSGGSTFFFDLEAFIADIDGDGTAEIFATIYQRKNSTKEVEFYFLGRWDPVIGTTDLEMTWGVNLGTNRPGIPGIADFDGDGLAEVYLKNRIYAAESGALLADEGGDWNTEVNSAPVAVNIIPGPGSPNLELVSGNLIYSVPNLAGRSLVSLSVAQDMNALGLDQYYPKVLNDVFEYGITNFSSTSVADFDDDGRLDVFLSGALGTTNGHTAVFYWNVANGTVGTFLPTHPDTGTGVNQVSYPNGWPWGTGRVNLGQLNSAAEGGLLPLEANFVAGNQLFALEESGAGQLVDLWGGPKTLNDFRSGVVTTTVYDFDNDGNYELVYRDTEVLSIIDGETGTITKWSVPCQSHTMTEGPIIADINGDGSTDICVPCYTNTGNGSFSVNDPLQQQALGEIRIFNSSDNSWLPSRKVYNQPGYFVVNINDDLTIPFPQLDQTMQFGSGTCSNGIPGPQQPLNTYLNQVPTINADGCPVYPGPDIAFVGDDPNLNPGDPGYVDPSDPNYFPAVEVIPPICGELAITVNFNIVNSGLRAITDDIPVTFWDGDPSIDPQPATPAQWLHSESLPITNFAVGDTLSFSGYTFNSTGKAFDLYIMLNDASTTAPIVVGGVVAECEIGNNIYKFPIIPRPFTVEIEIIQDNLKCEDTAPNNGELRAVVKENGVEIAIGGFGFQWYAGADTLSPIVPGANGISDRLTGMAEGDYTVVVTNTLLGCQSLPIDTAIVRIGADPVLTIIERSPQTQCSPLNGELEVQVQGGNLGYTFAWFDNLLNPLGVTSAVISNLAAGEYIVAANKDGCTKTESFTLGGPVFPDALPITTANILDCTDPNSGAVSASVQINGLPVADDSNYDFIWELFDPGTNTTTSQLSSIHGTGKTRTGLPAGWYAVTVRDKATGCESFPPVPTEVVNQTQIPTLIITELLPNTSCDPNDPNGQLRVDIQLGGIPQDPAVYTIEWFKGDNTSTPVLTTTSANGSIVSGVGSPGIPYTAEITSSFNCSAKDILILTQIIQVPVIAATVTNNSICDPALAVSGVFNGAAAATVTFAGNPVTDFAEYTFTWHDGPLVSDPVIAGETGSTITNRPAGFYTALVSLDSISCVSTPITVEIMTVPDNPVILITETPETTCSGTPNGALSAAVDVGGTPTIAGYTYEWYVDVDTSPTGTLVGSTSGSENETAIELDGNATYSVKVINDATGCSTVLPFNLRDLSKDPLVTLVKTDNVVCDPLIGFTGSVTATLTDDNGNPADLANYSFDWYQGVDETGTPRVDSNLATPLTLDGVEGNFYALVVTNLTLGCSSVPVNIEVLDIPPVIDIVITENIASINCDPALARGILAAGVDTGSGPVTAGYTFTWYKGPNTLGSLTDVDGTNDFRAINLQGGLGEEYTVHVLDNASGCDETLTITLGGFPFTPTISFGVTPNEGCINGLYSGQITTAMTWDDDNDPITAEVLIDLINPAPFDFTYAWTGPSGAIAIDNHELGDGSVPNPFIEDGVYNVTITENTTGCSFTPPAITVDAIQGDIIVTAIATPSTNCDPALANGKILVSVGYDQDKDGIVDDPTAANFDLTFYNGSGTSGTDLTASNGNVDDNGDGFNDLLNVQGGANIYTIVAEYGLTGCTVEVPVPLSAFPFTPTISFGVTPNEGCVNGLFSGQITTAMTWDDDNDPITIEVPIDLTNPTPFNFTYAWTGPSGPIAIDNYELGDGTVPNPFIEDGDYNVIITDALTGCSFSPPAITVDAIQGDIIISAIPTPSTNCDPALANGKILFTAGYDQDKDGIVDDPTAANFNLTFYDGSGTLGTDLTASNGSTDDNGDGFNDLLNIQGGSNTYTIVAEYGLTGCTVEVPVALGAFPFTPTISFTTLPDEGCTAGNYTGQITTAMTWDDDNDPVTPEVAIPLAGPAPFNFTYAWTGPTGALAIDNFQLGDGTVPNPFIQDGDYNVIITDALTGCSFSPPAITVIKDEGDIIVTTTNVPSTNCDPALANGKILITAGYDQDKDGIVDDPLAINFNLSFYAGTGTLGTDLTASNGSTDDNGDGFNDLINVQGANDYTVVVEYGVTGCTIEVPVTLEAFPFTPTISFTTLPNEGCTAGNFTGQITTAMTWDDDNDPGTPEVVIPLAGPAPFNFTYAWTGPSGALTPSGFQLGDGSAPNPFIEDGDYTVVITDAFTGCSFSPPAITVDNSEVPILIDFTVNTLNNSCASGNGVLTAGIDLTLTGVYDDNIANLGDYTFEWFKGGVAISNDPSSVGGIDANTAIELEGNDSYMVRITNTVTGCINTYAEVVQKIITIPLITIAVNDYADEVDCDDALITLTGNITNIAGFTPNAATDFIYTWYEGPDDTGVQLVSGNTFNILSTLDGNAYDGTNGIPVGDYTLKVQHFNSSCESDIAFVRVDEPPILFDITPTLVAEATTCDVANGQLFVTVSDNLSGFGPPNAPIYEWFIGAPTNTVPTRYYAWDNNFGGPGIGGYQLINNVTTASFYSNPQVAFSGMTPFESGPGAIGAPDGPPAELDGVETGVYTVVVTTDGGAGCKEYITVEMPIVGNQQNNVVTIDHDTRCDIDNGIINVTLTPDVGFTANLYDIYLIAEANPTLNTGNPPATFVDVLPGVNGGPTIFPPVAAAYTLTPGQPYTIASILNTYTGTECWSVPTSAVVEEWAHPPSFTVESILPNTSCDPVTTPSGELNITISHNPSELPVPPPTLYRIEAVDPTGTYPTVSVGSFPGSPLATGVHNIPGLGPVDYDITVFSDRFCETTRSINIPNQEIRPSVATATSIDPFNCAPLNGEARITLIEYTPVGSAVAVSVTAAGVAPNNFDSYDFDWYIDNGDNTFDPLADAPVITDAPSGVNGAVLDVNDPGYIGAAVYWVTVTNNNPALDGVDCSSPGFQFILIDMSVKPIFTTSVSANTSCDPLIFDGALYINPDRNAAVTPYTSWSLSFTSLPAAYDVNVGGTVPTPGTLTAPTPSDGTENGHYLIAGLLNGEYRFTITDDATGCTEDGLLNVPFQSLTPNVSNASPTPQYACNADGSIEIIEINTITPGSIDALGVVTPPVNATDVTMSNYTFSWYRSNDVNNLGPVIFTAVGGAASPAGNFLDVNTYGAIGSGRYWVEFVKTGGTGGLNCDMNPFPIDIDNQSVDPIFTFETVSNTSCDPSAADGTIFIDPDRNGAVPPNFPVFTSWTLDFTAWPSGYDTNPDGTPNPGGTVVVPAGLSAPTTNIAGEGGIYLIPGVLDGIYDFDLTDDVNGCSVPGQINIIFQQLNPDLSNATPAPQYACNADGSIEVIEINTITPGSIDAAGNVTPPVSSSDAVMSNYTFNWYRSNDVNNLGAVIHTGVGGAASPAGNFLDINTYPTIGSGRYWVEFVKTSGTGGLSCDMEPFSIDIDNQTIDPTFTFETVSNTSCDPLSADGSIYIDPDRNGAIPANFPVFTNWILDFTGWPAGYDTNPDGSPNPGGTVPVPGGLSAPTPDVGTEAGVFLIPGVLEGTYDFTLIDDANGCSINGQINIIFQQLNPSLSNFLPTPQFACNADGSIVISEINSITPGSIDLAGNVTPAINSTDLDMTNYTFTWYKSTDINNLGPAIHAGVGAAATPAGNFLDITTYPTISAGTYWVEFEKTSGSGGLTCEMTPVSVVLDNQSIDPAFAFATTSNTSCDPLSADGVIFIDPDRNGATPPNFPIFTTWTLDFTAWPSAYNTNPDGTPNPAGTVPVPGGLSAPTTNIPGDENGVFLIPGVLDGLYNFTLTDDANGCSEDGQLNIQFLQIPPTVANFTAVPQYACNADGSLEVLEITTAIPGTIDLVGNVTPATTIADGDMSNYTFNWYRSDDINNLGPVLHSGVGGNDPLVDGNYLNPTLYPSIGSGRYWVEFQKTGGSGGLTCTASPFPIDLDNQSIDPTFSISTVSNTACDLTSPSGALTIDPDRNGAVPPNFPVFTNWALAFTAWPAGFDTNPNGTPNPGGNTPTPPDLLVPTADIPNDEAGVFNITNLLPGRYDFTLIDNANGCDITGVLNIPDQPAVPTLTLDNATVVNQTICNPSGSITVNDADITLFDPNTGLPVPGLTTADFDYLWYLNDPTTLPLQDDLGNDIIIPTLSVGTGTGLAGEYSSMGAGTYWVQLVPNGVLAGLGAGCYGPPVSKVVIDISTDPIISFTTTVNSSCDVNMPNGEISGTTVEVSGPTADPYTFTWTLDGLALPVGVVQTDLGNVSTLTNAPDGTYVLTSSNGTTGCSFAQSQVLILDQSISEPNIISVSTVDPLNCLPTGSVTVTAVQVGGLPALVADFEFDWFIDDPIPSNQLRFDAGNNVVTTDPAFPPITGATLNLILPGSYFVIARELNTACESIVKEVNILPDLIVLPAVIVVEDRPQTSCDPLTPNGELSATADGQDSSNPDYLFSWYSGPFVDPANFVANGNSSTLTGADAGEYTVEVQNLITGCSNTGYYVVNDATEEFKLQVSVTTVPVTLCYIDDGVLEARVINQPDIGTFQFQWFNSSGISIGFGAMLTGVSAGTYSVVATDLSGTYCPSLITDGEVQDLRMPPPINISEDNPLINCDLSRPDGQLSADVNGRVGGYTFEWYTGIDTTTTSIHTGNILSGLTVGTYSVVVTDDLTQCRNFASGTITDGRLLPPSPTVTLLANVTDCVLPDGALTSDVGGDVLNYTFDWYDGNTVGNNPDNSGFDYFDLDIGEYTVTATDIRTGCVSLGVIGTIIDERVYPEFDYLIKPANCETSNGFIEMKFAAGFDVKDVIWYDAATGSEIDRATNLYDYEAGDYEVTVITQKGCEADGQATIPTEITNYNGISANGDNRNDDFQIDCITLFPNNNVKIFNRAGIKIYDRDGYDNDNIVFRGVGEMGVYLAGEELPDGTYFYIIDKGDGSRAKTGYLELIR